MGIFITDLGEEVGRDYLIDKLVLGKNGDQSINILRCCHRHNMPELSFELSSIIFN